MSNLFSGNRPELFTVIRCKTYDSTDQSELRRVAHTDRGNTLLIQDSVGTVQIAKLQGTAEAFVHDQDLLMHTHVCMLLLNGIESYFVFDDVGGDVSVYQ